MKPRFNLLVYFSGAAAFLVGVCALFLRVAARRPFWADETNGIGTLLTFPAWSQLVHGTDGQCSPSPLFYLLTKAMPVFGKVSGAFGDPLVTMRLISIAAGVIILGTVFYVWRLRPAVAVVVAAAIFRDELFLNHSVEARPYILWCCFTLLFSVCFRRLLAEPERRGLYLTGMALALAMALTASGSLFLFVGFGAWVLVFHRGQTIRLAWLFTPATLVIAYYLYIAPDLCANYAEAGNGQFSLTQNIARGDYHLLRAVIRPVVALTFPEDFPLNFAFLSLPFLFRRWRDRWLEERKVLKGFLLVFFLAFALTSAAVIERNYYFVPRMFIYLLVARIFLVATTVTIVEDLARERSRKLALAFHSLVGLYAVFCVLRALHTFPLTLL